MPRLTESQRRRIREENRVRRHRGKPLMTDAESASFVGVPYDASTWASDYGGWDSYSAGDHSTSPCDSGSFSCGGGGGCD